MSDENAAALKIQALQRGRAARREVEAKWRDQVLHLPPVLQNSTHVVVRVSFPAMRRLESWSAFTEVVESSGLAQGAQHLDLSNMEYSTAAQPEQFSNRFGLSTFQAVIAFDAAKANATKLRANHDGIMAHRPPPPAPPAVEEDDEEDTPQPKMSKKQRREMEEQRRADTARLKEVVAAEYAADCQEQRLRNVLSLAALRIPIV